MRVEYIYLPNTPPVVDAGPDQTVECDSPQGTPVALDGSGSSDVDGDPLTFTWTGPFPEGGGTVTGVTPTVTLPLGAHTLTLTVDDGNGGVDAAEVMITIDPGAACDAVNCPDDVLLSNYQTTPATQQFVDVTNVGSAPILLDGCSHTAFNVFTETTLGAATVALSGLLGPGETFRVGSAGAPGVDAVIPDGAMPAGPGAMVLLDAPPPPDGTPVSAVLPDDVTGMVYLSSTMVFGVSHLRDPAHNAIYACIYGATPPFVAPFTPVAACLGASKQGAAEREALDLQAMIKLARAGAAAETWETAAQIPGGYALETNYPNPFNPTTTIRFDLPEATHVTLKVYDLTGREVGTLVSDNLSAGKHQVVWSAGSLASGTYLYRLTAGSFVETKSMVLLK